MLVFREKPRKKHEIWIHWILVFEQSEYRGDEENRMDETYFAQLAEQENLLLEIVTGRAL